MNEKRANWWLTWTAFLVLVAILPLSASWLRRMPPSHRPATQVEGDATWPRTLVERFPDGAPGRRVVLSSPPQRIVSVTLATDEILMDMIGPERIVALSDLAPTRGSLIADRVDGIRHFVGADVESIIALEPDLCFLASYNRQEVQSLLVDSGIPIFVFRRFDSLTDIRDNLRMVGLAVGAEHEAERLVADMDRKLDAVAQRIPPRDQWPSALIYAHNGWAPGSGTIQADVFAAAGLRNAAAEAGIAGFAPVTEEQVLKMDPDFFVVVTRAVGMTARKEWLMNNPALAPVKAIRQEQFLIVEEPLLSTVSHRIADVVVELARQAYPDRFSDEH